VSAPSACEDVESGDKIKHVERLRLFADWVLAVVLTQARVVSVYLDSRISPHRPTDKFPDTRLRIRESTDKPGHTVELALEP